MGINKFYNLKVNPGAKSSRFVVDLKQDLAENEIKEIKKPINIETRLEEKIEKLARVDYGGYFNKGKEKAGEMFNYFDVKKSLANVKSFWIAGQARNNKIEKAVMTKKEEAKMAKRIAKKALNPLIPHLEGGINAALASNKLSNQLALVVLVKLLYAILKKIFHLLYKICYAVGWAIMFVLRLFYFLFLAIFNPFVKITKFLFFKSRTAVSGALNTLPTGYQATQAVATSVSVRLLRFFQKLA
ncbi:MAG: hypothetical protein PHF50_04710, partial [Patescibacteria group bacterium]|nr:hypothetical protein [Patescibacteria group bacterium]